MDRHTLINQITAEIDNEIAADITARTVSERDAYHAHLKTPPVDPAAIDAWEETYRRLGHALTEAEKRLRRELYPPSRIDQMAQAKVAPYLASKSKAASERREHGDR